MKLEITEEKILEAANKCSTAKDVLKTLFPEVFYNYYDFGENYKINTISTSEPFFIGQGFAPVGFSNKCLIVHPDYIVEHSERDGRQVLKFKRK